MKDGGQAFPWGGGIRGGMALRDWFAGQALTGRLATPPVEDETPTTCAEDCYEVADAMLATRAQTEGKS